MKLPTIEELYQAGAHFGHKKEKAHPRARSFVSFVRDRIQVINLEKTQEGLQAALDFIKKASREGKIFLFVGTKIQAKKIVAKIGEETAMPYVVSRWLGGMLTNFETILKNLRKIEQMEAEIKSEKFASLVKKERRRKEKQLEKLKNIFAGILTLKKLPDVLVLVDLQRERVALEEAKKTGIPVVAIADTNVNPEEVAYPIPANDDAPKTIELILSLIGETIKANKPKIKKEKVEEPK